MGIMARVLTHGDWLENAIQIQMTSTELRDWLDGFVHRQEKPPYELAQRGGSYTTEHFYLVQGVRMIVYEEAGETVEKPVLMPEKLVTVPPNGCPECMGRSVRVKDGQRVCASCLAKGRVVVV